MIEIAQDTETGKTTYLVNPEDCDIEACTTDQGIGRFEFWGAPGNDRQIETQIERITIPYAIDEDGNETQEPALLKALETQAFKNLKPWEDHLKKMGEASKAERAIEAHESPHHNQEVESWEPWLR